MIRRADAPCLVCALFLCVVVTAYGSLLSAADLLYDVDFSTPPHTIGQPPLVACTEDAQRDKPAALSFGDPVVDPALGALIDQPCAFGSGTVGYDQLHFSTGAGGYPCGFPVPYDSYHFEAVALVQGLAGTSADTLSILLDVPSVYRLDFWEDQTVTGGKAGFPVAIGTHTIGVPVFVELDLDIVPA